MLLARRVCLLLLSLLALASCVSRQVVTTTAPASTQASPPRIQGLDQVLAAAESFPCVAGLHAIPATVIDVGVFADVPYQSFSNGNVEVNVYGDPADPVGLEAGTRVEDPALQQCLVQFIAAQALWPADQQRVMRVSAQPSLDAQPGLTVEVTPRTAADAYDAWWISLERPEVIAAHRAPPQQLSTVTTTQAQWAPPPPAYYRRPPRVHVRYPTYRPPSARVYVPGFSRRGGIYIAPGLVIR